MDKPTIFSKRNVSTEGKNTDNLLKEHNSEAPIHQNGKSSSQLGTLADGHQPKLSLYAKSLRVTVYLLIKVLNVAYAPVFLYRMFQTRSKCSPVTDPILRIPAVDLARKIRRKELSAEEVLKAYISRINEVNPMLNAIVESRFEEALEDARQVDAKVSANNFLEDEAAIEQDYPLLGVPITIKGSLAVKGLKHTGGSVIRKDHKAELDADVVSLVRKAGAIPLLVSNTPELCMSLETTNKLIGTTKNPHDTTRTCGGSSGGEASLLAAGASVIGIGSDVAGSLRLPAHYCGIWGHKPTPGTVSSTGHYPSCNQYEEWTRAFTVGPMVRYATDLKTFLRVIAKPEQVEKLDLDGKVDLKKIKIYYSEHEDYYWRTPNQHCRNAVNKVVDHLRNVCGSEPQKIDAHFSQNVPDLSAIDLLSIEGIEDCFDGNGNGALTELMKYATFRSQHTFMLIMCGVLRKTLINSPQKSRDKVKNIVNKVRKAFDSMLGEDDILIVPSFPTEAQKHGDVLRSIICIGYLSIFNLLGYPVTNCPVGVTSDGLPVGVQIVSRPYGDKITLTLAEELEASFGGWIEPSDI
ncbi:fatty-acid amide hydrolase 2 isoform X2 [Dendroctonus ponderosae]|nr:fatty-acid amide hydrolase 2 isoform X2 [Dendroctonus ponderosae]